MADREQLQRDPENRLLARGPRYRLSGEVIRDSALKASGKLSLKMYGPGVFPPQPASVTAIAYGRTNWNTSTGPDRFRRSIYTFSKRTAPFAAYTVFDGPSGEVCLARRNRSNTPLQALTTLNDQMFIELAQGLAQRSVSRKHAAIDQDLVYIFRSILTRPPTKIELNQLRQFFETQCQRLESGELQPDQISGADVSADSSKQAALAMVARVVMNLDQAVTQQ